AMHPRLPVGPTRQALLAARERENLMKQSARDERDHALRQVPPHAAAQPDSAPAITGAFYAGWQETGIHSLRANADHLTHLFPVWLRVDAEGQGLDTRDWDPGLSPRNIEVLQICRDHRIQILPVLSNAHECVFDSTRAHKRLS